MQINFFNIFFLSGKMYPLWHLWTKSSLISTIFTAYYWLFEWTFYTNFMLSTGVWLFELCHCHYLLLLICAAIHLIMKAYYVLHTFHFLFYFRNNFIKTLNMRTKYMFSTRNNQRMIRNYTILTSKIINL